MRPWLQAAGTGYRSMKSAGAAKLESRALSAPCGMDSRIDRAIVRADPSSSGKVRFNTMRACDRGLGVIAKSHKNRVREDYCMNLRISRAGGLAAALLALPLLSSGAAAQLAV
jgi:hypothetical protein